MTVWSKIKRMGREYDLYRAHTKKGKRLTKRERELHKKNKENSKARADFIDALIKKTEKDIV